MATVQAILIAINASALKGKVAAQRLSMDLVKTAEYLTEKERLDFIETLIPYKLEWEKEFRRLDKQGLPRPNILPHPDDIVLDFRTGDA